MTPSPALRPRLLAWYDAQARALPWRVGPGERAAGVVPDPYRVWLSEIMLQQTTVPHAVPYFLEFIRRWPTVGDLAAAEDGEVMAAWAGLGYYARARNLLACARAVAREHSGVFPNSEAGLLALPGVGAYTAAAVAAIAFDRPANVVDGNIERVTARLFQVEVPVPDAKPELKRLAGTLVARDRPGDWAQALMDLGAGICRPRAPLCERCPIADDCQARAAGRPDDYPRKREKAARPQRHGAAFLLIHGGEIALVRRPDKGLLGGMLALPSSEWGAALVGAEAAPVSADWRGAGVITHVFTHFSLTLKVWRAEAHTRSDGFIWTPLAEAKQAMPTVFRKALIEGLGALL